MNRCVICGTGVPHEGMKCDKCLAMGSAPDPGVPEWVPRVVKLDELVVRTEQAVETFTPGPSKSRVWTDCPACAVKHLSAAYAALTSPHVAGKPFYATEWDVLAARAVIAVREWETGYIGNLAVAEGCLALAETLPCADAEQRKAWRAARLALASGRAPDLALDILTPPPLVALAAGHIVEALRELPALADRTDAQSMFSCGGFEPESNRDVLEWLVDSVAWVTKTYELRARE